MKATTVLGMSLFLLASSCGAPTAASITPNGATTGHAPSVTAPPPGFTSPNMPANATYPAIAAWTMYPLRLDPNPARAGQPVEIWTNVYMVDFLITFIIARLEVNGVQMDQARWTLYIDESDPHVFVFTPPAQGTYEIDIVANLEENEAYNQNGGEQMSISQSATLIVN